MTRRVAPSVLAADSGRLREQVSEVVAAGASVIHVDVMDGEFVPSFALGPGAVSALKELDVLLDVHLMVQRPERHVTDFVKAGADNVTIHAEATPHLNYAVHAIREAGATAGIALTPSTPPAALAEVAGDIWLALCMTVNPGWGGQKFPPASREKIRSLRGLVGGDVEVEVDGGIDAGTAGPAAAAGASLFVAGSALFGAPDPAEAYRAIADAIA